jgi:hypothetical protein
MLRFAQSHELQESDMNSGKIVFTTAMTLTSPGEKYSVAITGQDGEIEVAMTGHKKNPFYAMQPGRIRKITEEAFALIEKVSTPHPATLAPPVVEGPPWRR